MISKEIKVAAILFVMIIVFFIFIKWQNDKLKKNRASKKFVGQILGTSIPKDAIFLKEDDGGFVAGYYEWLFFVPGRQIKLSEFDFPNKNVKYLESDVLNTVQIFEQIETSNNMPVSIKIKSPIKSFMGNQKIGRFVIRKHILYSKSGTYVLIERFNR